MDRSTYFIERARKRQLEKLRDEAATSGDTTRFYDLTVAIRKSRLKLNRLLSD